MPSSTLTTTILPKFGFDNRHTYSALNSNPSARYIYRVHPLTGRGALVRGLGFFAPGCPGGIRDGHHKGERRALVDAASTHATQWKYPTSTLSPFISASYSIAYALFEARRWNDYHGCSTTQISVLDTAEIESDVWLATELVGTTRTDAAHFARSAEEVLVYDHIPYTAVVATLSFNDFLAFLPHWCDDIKPRIGRSLNSTNNVLDALMEASYKSTNRTPKERATLLMRSVALSIHHLRGCLPISMDNFHPDHHADAVDKIARLAALFCWWPNWIADIDPAAYPPMLDRVRDTVERQLRMEAKFTRNLIEDLEDEAAEDN